MRQRLVRFTILALAPLIFGTILQLATIGIAHADDNTMVSLVNPSFDKDVSGWHIEGDVSIETQSPISGTGSLRLGPGKASVSQRHAFDALTIAEFSATLKSDSVTTGGLVRFQCFDSHNHLVLDITQGTDPKKAGTSQSVGLYLKTQAHTSYVVVSIEKETDSPGYIYADDAILKNDDTGRVYTPPTCDLNQYLTPIWQGRTVYNETVLLESDNGQPASGSLLFSPDKILSIKDYSLTKTFIQGKDYVSTGKTITRTNESDMPFLKDTDYPTGQFPWYVIDGKPVVVTYTHDDNWNGPTPSFDGDNLPHTMQLLRQKKPITIVACGDSITLGDDVSSYMQTPPYMPTWAELFKHALASTYDDNHITLYNTALGGMTSQWGNDNAESTVASLEPDLVLIAFGMNDFWWMPPDMYKGNIQGIMDKVRKQSPKAEFILISSIPFDPTYTQDPAYTTNMAGYVSALKSLTGPGIQMLDMNAMGHALYAAKKPKDFLGNPLHPNDFLARWYAQGLAQMLTPDLH